MIQFTNSIFCLSLAQRWIYDACVCECVRVRVRVCEYHGVCVRVCVRVCSHMHTRVHTYKMGGGEGGAELFYKHTQSLSCAEGRKWIDTSNVQKGRVIEKERGKQRQGERERGEKKGSKKMAGVGRLRWKRSVGTEKLGTRTSYQWLINCRVLVIMFCQKNCVQANMDGAYVLPHNNLHISTRQGTDLRPPPIFSISKNSGFQD